MRYDFFSEGCYGDLRNGVCCKLLVAAFLLLLPLVLLSRDNSNENNHRDDSLPVIIAASEPDYPPFCFVDKNGNPAGFAVDLFRAAAEAAGYSVDFRIGVWEKIKQDLARGTIDALPLVGRTPEREDMYDFTMPYLSLHGAVFVRNGTTGISSVEDLRQKEVVVMKGDNAEEFVRRENITTKIFTTPTFDNAFIKLAAGEYDAVITQRIIGIRLLEQMGITSVEPLPFQLPEFRQDFCFAVTEGNDSLLASLSEGLSIAIANDTYEQLHYKWFGPEIQERIALKDILRNALYITVPLFIIFSVMAIITLRRLIKKRTRDLRNEIAGHKQTLELMHKQKLLLNEMEKVAKTGGWEYDIDQKIVTWTDGIYEIFAVQRNSFDPSDFDRNLNFIDNEDRQAFLELFTDSMKTGEPYDIELRLHAADGIFKWVHMAGRTELKNGKVVRMYGNISDITQAKQSHEKLKNSEEQIRLLLNSTAEGIIGIDTDGRCTFCNQSALRLLKYDDERSIKGESILQLIYDKHSDKTAMPGAGQGIIRAIEKGEGFNADNELFYRSDGSSFISEYFSHPVKKENKVVGAVIAFWDITRRKKDEEELKSLKDGLEKEVAERTGELNEKVQKLNRIQKAMLYMVEDLNYITAELKEEQQKLERSNKDLEAFTYSVSHDLRAPLRSISGFTSFLMEDYAGKLDSEGMRLLTIVHDNAKKMDTLITEILNLSRISRTEMRSSEIDMTALANSMYHEVATEEEKRSFSLRIKKMPPSKADPVLIKQVWQNLIGNALKYSSKSENKRIEIGAEDNNKEVIYYIKDAGAGFNPEYTGKLFGLFQRLHTENEFEGTGVGLAVVKQIINRHGGNVWAESRINKGATFFFSLPSESYYSIKSKSHEKVE